MQEIFDIFYVILSNYNAFVDVYIYTYIYVCVRVRVYVYVCARVCMCVCVYIWWLVLLRETWINLK